MNVQLTDRGTTSSRHMTDEGFLSVKAIFSTVGIQKYKESELFDGGSPDVVVSAFRPAETLSDSEFLKTLSMKPVTVDHPDGFVNSSNYNAVSRGHVGENASLKNNQLHGGMMVTDKSTVDDIQKRDKIDVSMGYSAKIIRETGIYDRECYTAVIKDMRANHVAIVDDGRCDGARILDKNEVKNMSKDKDAKTKEDAAIKKVEDQNLVESVVEQLLANKAFVNQVLAAVTKSPNLVKQLGAAIATQSAGDGAATDGDGTDNTGDTPTTGATSPTPAENQLDHKTIVDTAVNERMALIADAKSLFSLENSDVSDKSNIEIMKVCINDDKMSDDVSEDFVKGRFAALTNQRRHVIDALGSMADYAKPKNDNESTTEEDIAILDSAVCNLNGR